MSGELILLFFLLRYLRKSSNDYPDIRQWDKVLLWLMYVIPVLLAADLFLINSIVSKWIGSIMLLAVVAIAYLLPALRSFRNILFAILPLAVVSVLENITNYAKTGFAHKLNGYFETLYPFTILWLVVLLIIFNKQRKALQQEREKRLQEENQNKLVEARKTELEEMVGERTAELLAQKEELEHTLAELKDTQAQLIQSEKMASLGEPTAGIAHEIQNPLNFVNNFSEVSNELIVDMNAELANGDINEARAIANDIKQNLEKINLHGRRADAIVKGMLQHSRVNSGTREPTDINALADEYLRLSYHGLRAKDKSFNADFKTDFDESIGKINVVPQDIGRVLLNLFNNAFYAVSESKKQKDDNYKPAVYVTTKKQFLPSGESKVSISVRDNGPGIPQNIVDKIFHPFFTTKPSGQGTGLGLSLSYDIVKAHGGELIVDSVEGEGAKFIILLSLSDRM